MYINCLCFVHHKQYVDTYDNNCRLFLIVFCIFSSAVYYVYISTIVIFISFFRLDIHFILFKRILSTDLTILIELYSCRLYIYKTKKSYVGKLSPRYYHIYEYTVLRVFSFRTFEG